MKKVFKIGMTIMVIGAVTLFAACNNTGGDSKKEQADTSNAAAGHSEDHIYACPMHPEVTGKEGDTCPKCGMKLEHNDNAGAASNVSMQFSTNPATVNPNQEVTLSLTPK